MRTYILFALLIAGTLALRVASNEDENALVQSLAKTLQDLDLEITVTTTQTTTTTPLQYEPLVCGYIEEDIKPEWCQGQSDVCSHLYAYCMSTGRKEVQCKSDWLAILELAVECHETTDSSNFDCYMSALHDVSQSICYWPYEWEVCTQLNGQIMPEEPERCYTVMTDCLGTGRSTQTCAEIWVEYTFEWQDYCTTEMDTNACYTGMSEWAYYYYPEIFDAVTITAEMLCRFDPSTCPVPHYCETNEGALSMFIPGSSGTELCFAIETFCLGDNADNEIVQHGCQNQWITFSNAYSQVCPNTITYDEVMTNACTTQLWDMLEIYYFSIYDQISSEELIAEIEIPERAPPPPPSTNEWCDEEINSQTTYLPIGVTASQFCDTLSVTCLGMNGADTLTMKNHWQQFYWSYYGACGSVPSQDQHDFCHNVFLTELNNYIYPLCTDIQTTIESTYVTFDFEFIHIPVQETPTGPYWCDDNDMYSMVTMANGQQSYDLCVDIGTICLNSESGTPQSCSSQWHAFFTNTIQGCYPEPENFNNCHDQLIWNFDNYYFDVFPEIEIQIQEIGTIEWTYSEDWEFPVPPSSDLYWCGVDEYRTTVLDASNGYTMYDYCVDYSGILITQYDVDIPDVQDSITDFYYDYTEYCPPNYFYTMTGECQNFYHDWVIDTIVVEFPDISVDLPEPQPIPEPSFEFCEEDPENANIPWFFSGNLMQFCTDITNSCVRATNNPLGCQQIYEYSGEQYGEHCEVGDQSEACRNILISIIEQNYMTITEEMGHVINTIYNWDLTTQYTDSEGNFKYCKGLQSADGVIHGVSTVLGMCNDLTNLCMADDNGSFHTCKTVVLELLSHFNTVCGPDRDNARDDSCHNYFVYLLEEFFFSHFPTIQSNIIAQNVFTIDLIPLAPSYPVTWCDAHLLSHEISFVSCSSDLEYCQQLAYTCMTNTHDQTISENAGDAQTCANNWGQHYSFTIQQQSMYDSRDPYRDYGIYQSMKANGDQIYGYQYSQFMAQYEQGCPGPVAPPPDPTWYCAGIEYSETFFGQSSDAFCSFLGAKCGEHNDGGHEECQIKWLNFYNNYANLCPAGQPSFDISTFDITAGCACETMLISEVGPVIYGETYDSWVHEFFHTQGTVESECPCLTLESGMFAAHLSLSQTKSTTDTSNRICRKQLLFQH